MKIILREKSILFIFFIFIILLGAFLLCLPISWQVGAQYKVIDCLFTSVSAVCVTGLSTVSITGMTVFGQIIVLVLIQIGGLGLIAFSFMFLSLPRQRLTIANSNIIKNYFTSEEIVDPRFIIKLVLKSTLVIEGIGAILLFFSFKEHGIDNPVFTAIFHSISAFCNAGFSTIDNGLIILRDSPFSSIVFMVLIVTGGIGFLVHYDIRGYIRDKRDPILLHTKIMLIGTSILILGGAILYYIFEYNNSTMEGLSWNQKIVPAFFQSVTTRTAGFNTIDQGALTQPSKFITLGLMLIGGGSGSTAGGIKITTAFLLVCLLYQGLDEKRGVTLLSRKIDNSTLNRASVFFVKAMFILFFSIFSIVLAESFYGNRFTFIEIVFETFSALATVGLSLGITQDISPFTKLILIFTMFAGRIGLFALVLPANLRTEDRKINYPQGEVLLG